MKRLEVPVLVVGAGPVGVTASILLAGQGIENHLVDRRTGPHRAPQAHVVNARSLEICRAAGVDMAAIRAQAVPQADGGHVYWVTTLAGEVLGRLPYERQGDDVLAYTPTPLVNLSQHRFEPILLERLKREPLATVCYRHEWQMLEQDDDGVTSRIEDLESGTSYEVRSRYLLAADGAGSRVRKALGVEMIGPPVLQSFIMIHFRAGLRELVGDRPGVLYWTMDPEASGAFVAHDIDSTWVFMHPYDAESESADAYTEEVCRQIVGRAIGRSDTDFEIRDISPWTMTAQVAASYRRGRVFLVGDSAHRFPPSGGLGMNTGIQDAHNLVWKIGAVETGLAGARLLDSYQTERRPVAQHNADQSVNNAMRMMEVFEALGLPPPPLTGGSSADMLAALADEQRRARLETAIGNQQEHFDLFGLQLGFRYQSGALVADDSPPPVVASAARDYAPTSRPGARVPHAWVERDGERISLLDLLPYNRFTLVAGSSDGSWTEAAARIPSPHITCLIAGRDFRDLEGHWASVCEIEHGGALLVRPDQHVAWRTRCAPSDPRAALEHALDAVLMRTSPSA